MEKRRLFRILAKAENVKLAAYAEEIRKEHEVMMIKKPEKSLAMVKMREPVQESLFYIGEVLITEAVVEIEGKKGIAVTMGDDFDKTVNMAVIDAAMNAGIFKYEQELMALEQQQKEKEEKENAMFLKTKVDFHSMDSEVQV